jgi:hypothetical protein
MKAEAELAGEGDAMLLKIAISCAILRTLRAQKSFALLPDWRTVLNGVARCRRGLVWPYREAVFGLHFST